MITDISGKITSIFPDDINTDDIIPAWTLQESTKRSFFAKYAFANYDKDFVNLNNKENNNIIVAGENFGCGSSREQAVYALQENGVKAIIAKSYPDIFFRNCLNNGLVLITMDDIIQFHKSDRLAINLEKKEIKINGRKKVGFKMDEEVAKTFILGGKIGRIRNHLSELLKKADRKKIDFVRTNIKSSKPKTIAEKIISDHLGYDASAGDKLEKLSIDILFFNEVIAPPALNDSLSNFSDIYAKNKKKFHVFDKKRVFLIPDHTVPSSSVAVSEGIDFMEKFAKNQGIKCYKEGDGIEHVVLIEDGQIVPGEIILGTDSHTDTSGALNTLAFGVGTTDASFALPTGYLYDFEVPKTIRVNLHGKLGKGTFSKDIILYLIGKLGVDGASRRIVEFGGPALSSLSMDARTTVANMAVEMGARTAIFECDKILKKYIDKRAKYPYKAYMPDRNCNYEKIINIDLSSLEPMVAFPHKPGNVTPVSKLDQYMRKSQKSKNVDFAGVNSLHITDAFLGACTNGRYEDFVVAAKVIKDRKVNPQVNFVVIPASRKVYNRLLKDGILTLFADAGANIESSNCGPCFGKHMGVVGAGAQMISSSNRNYIGRMGSREAKIFLASPVTVTAAAIAGKIVDPRIYL
ncbi:aconitase/3-isopropylmalate dehydratase large subunit family protein [Patescibacteria group bacterium]|nr:aconitase/3-isopropylmalate dehydratase large subunit family protein [Patescibacteria group bacterium]MCL5798181.1 aconitase/3-isopropylmalate dehydratase large subunit family protein [Patescibacteria group bacterium]